MRAMEEHRMWGALSDFFSGRGLMPHGHCYLWAPDILWTHVVSDLLIGLSYTTIPLSLWYLLRRRRDIPFNSIVALFGVFIISCGITHFVQVWTTWHPAYRLAGAAKAITAAASVLTAVQVVRMLPAAIALPDLAQYRGMYEIARESQASYRAILEAGLDGFYVLEPVRGDGGEVDDARIVDLNRAAASQLRLPREGLAGRLLSELEDGGILLPLLPLLREVTASGAPLRREHRAGDRVFIAQVAPLREGLALTLHDISELTRAVQAAQESESRYRLVVSRAPITFFALDQEGRYLLADGRAYHRLGIDPATLKGRSAEEVFDGAPPARALITRALAGEEVAAVVDLGPLVVKSQVSPLRGPDGEVVGATGLSVDITEQVRAERELARLAETLERRVEERTRELEVANEELQSFAYTVAHDLRSPLRSMDGFADAIARDDESTLSEASKGYLGRVRASAGRLSRLIDDLLKLSRVTRVELLRQEVDLSEVAHAVVAELRSGGGEPRHVEVEPGLRVTGDPFLLRIALENLLSNAWKFTARAAEPRIAFRTVPRGEGRAFVVTDNGVGFDMQHAGHLFVAFQRLHRRTDFEGTGIGLATVKRIVARHGGEVWVEAEEGVGAAFYFTLA